MGGDMNKRRIGNSFKVFRILNLIKETFKTLSSSRKWNMIILDGVPKKLYNNF